MAKPAERKLKVVADNRKARFHYEIGEIAYEPGISLTGSEVKSARTGKVNIGESYAGSYGGELWLYNSNISEYKQAGRDNHEPKRRRKLLLHKRQINKLIPARSSDEGMTVVVPLKLYFNEKGRAKVEIALAKGKKLHDKRETDKKRSWERERGRIMPGQGMLEDMSVPTRLDHCVIHVSDWVRSNAFYRDVMNAELNSVAPGRLRLGLPVRRRGGSTSTARASGLPRVARLPVRPGNSDLCAGEWQSPIADAMLRTSKRTMLRI